MDSGLFVSDSHHKQKIGMTVMVTFPKIQLLASNSKKANVKV